MKLTETQSGVVRLDGALTMDSVADTQLQLDKMLVNGAMTLDFGGVSHCDSAALALLLALRRRKDARNIKLSHIPAGLYGLARLYELTPLLELPPETRS